METRRNNLRDVLSVIIFFIVYVLAFSFIFIQQGNYEFIFYIIVLLTISAVVVYSYKRGVRYTKLTLWLLAIWGFLHFLGGSSLIGEGVVYSHVIVDLVGEPYNILKYDQLIHLFGFFTSTFVAFDILKDNLIQGFSKNSILFLVVFTAMGLGALNEIIEFFATIYIAEVNVGGYVNNALDLLFNALGAIAAGVVLAVNNFKKIF